MKVALLGLGAMLIASPALAQHMNAEDFYQRATRLKARGPLALLSGGEIKLLMTEAQRAGLAARNQRLATLKAEGKPRYCPPPGKHTMASSDFMHGLGNIPATERKRIDMTEATTRILAAKYPCPR